jgi:predicted nuclease of predicted toxin-antitoxin system
VRILADMHISPRTVAWLRSQGHDVLRVDEVLTPSASDRAIVAEAIRDERVVLTHDLDFTAIVATSGKARPSVISLRLSTARIDQVNQRLGEVLPVVEQAAAQGALITVEDALVRTRNLPLP